MLQISDIFLLVSAVLCYLSLLHFRLLSELNQNPSKSCPYDRLLWMPRLFAANSNHGRLNNYALRTIVPQSILSVAAELFMLRVSFVLSGTVRIAPAVAIAGEQFFNTIDKVSTRNSQSICEFKDGCERRAVFTAFQQADVFGVVSALKCQRFLCQLALLPQLKEDSGKCTLFPGTRLRSSCHVQNGVCRDSFNTSTKYSIPMLFLGFSWNTLTYPRCRKEVRERTHELVRSSSRTNRRSNGGSADVNCLMMSIPQGLTPKGRLKNSFSRPLAS
jgi:hypothetical protein